MGQKWFNQLDIWFVYLSFLPILEGGGGKFLPTTWTTYPRYPMTNRVKENLEIQPFLLHFRTPRYLLKFLKNFGKILYDYKYRFVRLLVCPSVSLLWQFCIFPITFSKNWCQSMSKWLIFDTNRHEQTLKIDINHNKNHWRTVLWLSTRQKLTILRIFDHFPRQIEVDWCQYVCYLNKYSSDTLTGCRNWYKSLWKPLKSVIVAIYTTKTVNFAHFRTFLTSNRHQLTSICVLSQ